MVQTVATAGKTVVFSALTVAVAMCGLFVFGLPILSSFGIAGLGVVLLCMAAAVTLLPAVLAAVGGKIPPTAPVADAIGRFYRLTRWVQTHAVAVGAASTAFLVLLGVPFLNARFEIGDARTLPPSSEVRDVALTLAERFPARGTDPLTVIAETDADNAEFLVWYEQLSTTPGVAGVAIRPDTPDGLTVVDVTPTGTSQGAEASHLVAQLRDSQQGFDTEVGGIAAELIDIKTRLSERLPLAALMVIVATLVLLFLMTGSIIVPIKAVVMNILSLCASFGALVWIFQDGHLAGFFDFESVGALDLWMPVLILIFAFGLSMDYEVFLLSRVKEVHDETGDNDLAVAIGLQRSGRIITSAAVLIVIVFAGFAAGEVLAIKQLGVGLAIAVLVDATLVRTLLVPATMRASGRTQLVGARTIASLPRAIRTARSTITRTPPRCGRHRPQSSNRQHRAPCRGRAPGSQQPMTPSPDIAVPELDELTITIVVDNVTDTLSSISEGIPQLPELAYLLGGIPSGQHDGHDCVTTFDRLCVACHGFSALATARLDDQTATVLFDVGPYGDVWLANAERLALDLSNIDVLFLSHWHWDHSGGITAVVAAIRSSPSRRRSTTARR